MSLRYAQREVLIDALVAERVPDLLDLCRDHVDRMTPPAGWVVTDVRIAEDALTR